MTHVEFHVLPENSESGPALIAAQLCEKAVVDGKKVHVHVPDETLAADVDKLLWTFRQGSFIAHERQGEALSAPLPSVLIGQAEPPVTHHDVLINFDAAVPAFFSRFERVIEIVHGDATARAQSRERFKFYRDRGYPLDTHKL